MPSLELAAPETDRRSNRMINVGGLCGIITTNVERYAYAGFGFAFLICLCLIAASATIFQVGYTKFGERSVAV